MGVVSVSATPPHREDDATVTTHQDSKRVAYSGSHLDELPASLSPESTMNKLGQQGHRW